MLLSAIANKFHGFILNPGFTSNFAHRIFILDTEKIIALVYMGGRRVYCELKIYFHCTQFLEESALYVMCIHFSGNEK